MTKIRLIFRNWSLWWRFMYVGIRFQTVLEAQLVENARLAVFYDRKIGSETCRVEITGSNPLQLVKIAILTLKTFEIAGNGAKMTIKPAPTTENAPSSPRNGLSHGKTRL